MRRALAIAWLSFAGVIGAGCSGAQIVPLPTLAVLPSVESPQIASETPIAASETPFAAPTSTEAEATGEAEIAAIPTSTPGIVAQGALTFWQPVAGDLVEGEAHVWEFAAQAGDPIQARVIGPATLTVTLSGGGDVLADGDDARVTLASSGVYSILVEPQSGAECPCHYELGLSYTDRPNPAAIVPSEVPPIIGIPTPTPPPYIDLGTFGGELTNGGSARGAFLTPDENQVFTFEATAGQYINVRAVPVSGPIDPIIVLYNPSAETILASDDDTGGGESAELRNIRLPENGQYTLQVRTGGGVGEYEVSLSSAAVPAALTSFITPLPSLTPYPSIPTPTVSAVESGYRLENHVPVLGHLQRPGSLDRYAINAAVTEGQTLMLTIGVSPVAGSAFRPQIQVYGPLGDLLTEMKAQDANAGGDAFIAALPVELTGVYVVYVTAEDGGSVGEYIISYGEGGFRHDVFRSNTESVRAYEGSIERPGLREVFYLYLNEVSTIKAAA
ncbi:MAG: PPC domain-containing protein, partial [Burkholderiales bacterium]|nr:PPC domain-containing protein [Anaerolineae bacterium]